MAQYLFTQGYQKLFLSSISITATLHYNMFIKNKFPLKF